MEIGIIFEAKEFESLGIEESTSLNNSINSIVTERLLDINHKFSAQKTLQTRVSFLKPLGGSAGASISAEKDSDGNTEIKAEGHGSIKSEDGSTKAQVEGEVKVDREGKVSGSAKISIEKEF